MPENRLTFFSSNWRTSTNTGAMMNSDRAFPVLMFKAKDTFSSRRYRIGALAGTALASRNSGAAERMVMPNWLSTSSRFVKSPYAIVSLLTAAT